MENKQWMVELAKVVISGVVSLVTLKKLRKKRKENKKTGRIIEKEYENA